PITGRAVSLELVRNVLEPTVVLLRLFRKRILRVIRANQYEEGLALAGLALMQVDQPPGLALVNNVTALPFIEVVHTPRLRIDLKHANGNPLRQVPLLIAEPLDLPAGKFQFLLKIGHFGRERLQGFSVLWRGVAAHFAIGTANIGHEQEDAEE